jgi:hypothetical protein
MRPGTSCKKIQILSFSCVQIANIQQYFLFKVKIVRFFCFQAKNSGKQNNITKKDGRQSLATVFGLFTLFLKLSLFICSAAKGFIFLAGPTYRTSFLLQSELQTELIPFLYSSFLPFLYVFL